MKRFLQLVSLVAILIGSSVAQQSNQSPIQAQVVVPRLIRFSGQLPGTSGTVGITFTLHKAQQDNAALWIETQNVQLDSTGKYTVLLGVTKPEGIPTDLFSTGEAQWLGIQVQGKTEQPRVLLVSVPYALRAAEADTLAGHAPSDFVTTDKLSGAVQQQLQQQSTSTTPGTGKKAGVKASTPTDPETDFIDNNASQVVLVQQNGSGSALVATATTGMAVNAKSTSTAIYGNNTGTGTTSGVEGITSSPSGRGVYGFNTATTGTNFGVVGSANSTAGIGVFGSNGATSGPAVGVWGTTSSTAGIALKGSSSATTGATTGVLGSVKSPTGTALVLQNTGSGPLFSGESGTSNTQVVGIDGYGDMTTNGYVGIGSLGTPSYPIESSTSTNEYNIVAYDYATTSYAIYGYGTYAGVYGDSPYVAVWGNGTDWGLYATASGSGEYGVEGYDEVGYGVFGSNATTSYPAAEFANQAGAGTSGVAVIGISASGSASTIKGGVDFFDAAGEFEGPNGVIGTASSDSTYGHGLTGISAGSSGAGVYGYNTGSSGSAVYGNDDSGSSTAYAGYFVGNVEISGTLNGTALAVKVDDPTDPANKYLSHASVQSPELKTFYDGTVVLDGSGQAEVTLPSYFQALNKDFRYQLTCIGGYAPVYIAREVENNAFRIAGGAPGMKVSWTVTGVRHDAYATAHPLVVETQKSAEEQGRYISPRELGVAAELKVGARPQHATSHLMPSTHTRPKPTAPPKQQSLEKIAAK
jgi:hypothetical protein